VSGRRVELTDLLRQIAAVAVDLPPGAEVSVTWWDAPPDLVLVLALQPGGRTRGAHLGNGGDVISAEWTCGGVVVRAQRSSNPTGKGRAILTLVKS
jgi:hypothetical protein